MLKRRNIPDVFVSGIHGHRLQSVTLKRYTKHQPHFAKSLRPAFSLAGECRFADAQSMKCKFEENVEKEMKDEKGKCEKEFE